MGCTGRVSGANSGTDGGIWRFNNLTEAATIGAPSGANPGSASATHSFRAAGIYKVTLTISDNCGGSGGADKIAGIDLLVVVYDPAAGFVTGGGWIDSPSGAYLRSPSPTG